MRVAAIAGDIGKGLVAGLAGTVAMTASSTVEQRLRKRAASSAPAEAAARVLGIGAFRSDDAKRRFGTLVHWGYGTGWGVARGLLRGVGVPPAAATAGHFSAIWGGSLVALPTLDVAPPVTTWPRKEVAIDVWHHLVYAIAAGMCYEFLEGRT